MIKTDFGRVQSERMSFERRMKSCWCSHFNVYNSGVPLGGWVRTSVSSCQGIRLSSFDTRTHLETPIRWRQIFHSVSCSGNELDGPKCDNTTPGILFFSSAGHQRLPWFPSAAGPEVKGCFELFNRWRAARRSAGLKPFMEYRQSYSAFCSWLNINCINGSLQI